MNPATLRVIDANANRAREALRVIEDYARFVLNSDVLCRPLKQLRHDLTESLKPVLTEAILFRDTPNDVGTTTKTTTEQTRDDLNHVITASGKRLGEALRAIEEFLKTEDAPRAAKIESLRYRFYDLEQKLARTLRPAACGLAGIRLYVLITESLCKTHWLDTARQAIEGGADCLQLREKGIDSGELLHRARQLVELCHAHHVPCIINDRADIAIASGADGIHVGQTDLPATEARKLIGRDKILGVSTHNIEQARQAVLDGADYIGVGPIYRSTTKTRDFLPGLDYARQAASEIRIPAIAIAGITPENVDEVLSTGLRAVAVTASVIGCENVKDAARALKEKLSGTNLQSGSAT
jgi:thiamine-phosphate pyrophosphorylase